MTAKERVLMTLSGMKPDRIPLNVFAGWNPGVRDKVIAAYGSMEAFNVQHHIDIVTGVLPRFAFRGTSPSQAMTLEDGLECAPDNPTAPTILSTPCDDILSFTVAEALCFREQQRAIFCHAWGVFELTQFLFEEDGLPGTEQALLSMAMNKEKMKRIFLKLGAWSADCVENAIKAGVDAIELSDDWGQQKTMLFSPHMWWDMVYPATKLIVDRARDFNVPVLLHSDGDVTKVLDGIAKLGLSGLHPVQESAGMSIESVRAALGPRFCIMGGMDTVTALPVMNPQEIQREVERVFAIAKESGSFIFAGSHMFQEDTSLEVIAAAYERAYALAG